MALTNDESRRLTELAEQLNAEDPTLARHLTGPAPATHSGTKFCWSGRSRSSWQRC